MVFPYKNRTRSNSLQMMKPRVLLNFPAKTVVFVLYNAVLQNIKQLKHILNAFNINKKQNISFKEDTYSRLNSLNYVLGKHHKRKTLSHDDMA